MKKNMNPIGYQMSKKMFNAILETRTEAEKNKNPYEFVMNIINEEFGLKGTVTSLSIGLN